MLWLNSLIFISSLPLGFLSGSSNRRDSRETRNQVKRERNILPVIVLLYLLMLPFTLKWQLMSVFSVWFSQNQLHFALPKIAVSAEQPFLPASLISNVCVLPQAPEMLAACGQTSEVWDPGLRSPCSDYLWYSYQLGGTPSLEVWFPALGFSSLSCWANTNPIQVMPSLQMIKSSSKRPLAQVFRFC